eukprot:scaffold19761_cov124-Isochrysis_galbana.AAC.2
MKGGGGGASVWSMPHEVHNLVMRPAPQLWARMGTGQGGAPVRCPVPGGWGCRAMPRQPSKPRLESTLALGLEFLVEYKGVQLQLPGLCLCAADTLYAILISVCVARDGKFHRASPLILG